MLNHAPGATEGRSEHRDEVHHRARAYAADGRPIALLVVNLSAGGLMARSEESFGIGDRLRVQFGAAGQIAAEVRWALGGRIGCRFDRPLPPLAYDALLAALRRA